VLVLLVCVACAGSKPLRRVPDAAAAPGVSGPDSAPLTTQLDLGIPDLPAPDTVPATAELDLGIPDLATHQAPDGRPLAAACENRQALHGHITPEIAAAPFVCFVPADQVLHVAIGLPMRHPDASTEDTGMLTPEEFTDRYGATPEDYQAVVAWTQANGFTAIQTYANRLLVGADGSAEVVGQAFCVNLGYYLRPDGSLFYAPDREPSVDPGLPIDYISNLDDFGAPHGPPQSP
jgi:hypothetical protein